MSESNAHLDVEQLTPERLAAKFREVLASWLTGEELSAIDVANQAEPGWPNTSICHSHDYCDANQAMLDAGAEFGIDASDACHAAIVNEAWSIAKRQGFCG